ncbi:unnamed protein product [Arabidopsis halleri]
MMSNYKQNEGPVRPSQSHQAGGSISDVDPSSHRLVFRFLLNFTFCCFFINSQVTSYMILNELVSDIREYGEPPTMGAANLRRSLSPLHTEFEALLWAMKCMIGADNQEVAFLSDCSDLVKMVFSPTEWPAFSVYLEEFQSDKEEFSTFSLSLISRNANVKADNLARKVRTEPLHITYVNNIPQEWLF